MAGQIDKSAGTPGRGMRVFGSYALVYLVEGRGRYRDARGVNARVKTGDTILVFPELPHRYGPGRGEEWEEIYLCFTGPLFETWRREGILDPSRPLYHAEPVDEWLARLRDIAETPRPATAAEHLDQLGRVTSALAGLIAPPPDAAGGEPDWLQQARGILASNLERELDWDWVSAQVGMTYETFRKAFAARAGIPPARYRAQSRIEAAKVLLKRQELTQAAIARSLGFHDEFHFSKRFKEMTGVSPKYYATRAPFA